MMTLFLRRLAIGTLCLGLLLCLSPWAAAANAVGDPVRRSWIAAMKDSSRGPFARIRWFCADGTVQPPQAYACSERGGGIQHGEWTDRVRQLRAEGYLLGNVLAAVDAPALALDPTAPDTVAQLVLERFLMAADDGWIFRGARTYRGALQLEDEVAGGRRLLRELLQQPDWLQHRYLLLREAVRWLPHGGARGPVTEMRERTLVLAEQDPGFAPFRARLHILPEAAESARVRDYARALPSEIDPTPYLQLADLIDRVHQPEPLDKRLHELARQRGLGAMAQVLQQAQSEGGALESRRQRNSWLLRQIRDRLPLVPSVTRRLDLMDLSLQLEEELVSDGAAWLTQTQSLSRQGKLRALGRRYDALYGLGLLDPSSHETLRRQVRELLAVPPSLADYRAGLAILARVADMAERRARFHLDGAIERWQPLEPLAGRLLSDRLRGGVLAPAVLLTAGLQDDADRLAGQGHLIFGERLAGGLRALNPGLARGVLRQPELPLDPARLASDSLVILPETLEDLPPVAGIITRGEGNALSHVQMLARNLGIPNLRIDDALLPRLQPHLGQPVVLAVTPKGRVVLAADGPAWDAAFPSQAQEPQTLIVPDLERLDLSMRTPVSLAQLGAADAGRVAGPKAANLAELRRLFPEAVAPGLVLPFGLYRQLLEQPFEDTGLSALRWLQRQYDRLARFEEPQRRLEAPVVLARMRQWFATVELPTGFQEQLRAALVATFGAEGSYGVFVRSDTNIEDLPGFSGAGLNKTVPHVVGEAALLAALRTVWASPFSERAWRWRQAHMEAPEHVYVSVLLQRSVPSTVSGVLVTSDVDSGDRGWLTVAASAGVGGAVAGQRAEEWRLERSTGRDLLLAPAGEPWQRRLRIGGGLERVAAPPGPLLGPAARQALRRFAAEIERRFPLAQDNGRSVAADVEFAFVDGRLALFQIRPFVESGWARRSRVLQALDAPATIAGKAVNLQAVPEGER